MDRMRGTAIAFGCAWDRARGRDEATTQGGTAECYLRQGAIHNFTVGKGTLAQAGAQMSRSGWDREGGG